MSFFAKTRRAEVINLNSKLLEKTGVAVVPGDAFGACGAGFLRCAYATGMDNIREGMKRMAEFVAKVRAERK